MALYDWNNDGKKDWQDDYIEYQVYKDVTGQNKQDKQRPSSDSGNGGGMSTFGAMVSIIGGLLLFAALFILLHGDAEDMENMPVILIVVFWTLCSGAVAYFVGKLEK